MPDLSDPPAPAGGIPATTENPSPPPFLASPHSTPTQSATNHKSSEGPPAPQEAHPQTLRPLPPHPRIHSTFRSCPFSPLSSTFPHQPEGLVGSFFSLSPPMELLRPQQTPYPPDGSATSTGNRLPVSWPSDPMPSWPCSFRPQQKATPSFVIPQEWWSPAVTARNLNPPATADGINLSPVDPCPRGPPKRIVAQNP